MKTKHFLIAAALMMCGQCYAQSGRSVHGVIMDSLRRPLPWGIVKLVSEKRDSLVVTADESGQFVFHPVKGKQITVTEYPASNTVKRYRFTLQHDDTDVGAIIIENMKSEVEWSSVNYTQYKAKDYKPRETHSIDSVLNKLPSLDIDTDGSITHNGHVVTKVRINGKDYLGGDAQSSIKNLPADVVEKIQIIDDYDTQATLGESKKDLSSSITVINKVDTIMYNVAAYKTGGRGRLADLLKKLPGLQMNADGNLLTLGQPVIRFSVDGKAYSDNKWKRAMKNMHADLISKVLLIDDYENVANLTSIKTPEPEKVIDIITKKQ